MADVTIHFGRVRSRVVTLAAGVTLHRIGQEILERLYDRGILPRSCALSFWRPVAGTPQQVNELGVTVGDMLGWTPANEVWVLPNEHAVDP